MTRAARDGGILAGQAALRMAAHDMGQRDGPPRTAAVLVRLLPPGMLLDHCDPVGPIRVRVGGLRGACSLRRGFNRPPARLTLARLPPACSPARRSRPIRNRRIIEVTSRSGTGERAGAA